jgi:hypothetical protein
MTFSFIVGTSKGWLLKGEELLLGAQNRKLAQEKQCELSFLDFVSLQSFPIEVFGGNNF